MRQEISEPVDTNRGGLHQLNLSGYLGRNWTDFHKGWIGYWNAHTTAEVLGVPIDTFKPSNTYLEWYHNHTILYITPPIQQHAQHDQMLYGVSGQFKYLMGTMQHVGQQSHEAFQLEDTGGHFHSCFATIVDGAYGSMQYLQRFDRMVVGDFNSFNHNPSVPQEIPEPNRVRSVPTQGGPSSSRSRRRRHGLQDEVIGEQTIQHTEAPDINAMPPIQNISAFSPQVTSFPYSSHIGLDATPLSQFPTFGAHPTPSSYYPAFGGQYPSSSHEPPVGDAITVAASSSASELHPIFTLRSGMGGTSPILDLLDYYSLGQPMTVPTSIQPVCTTGYGHSGDFVTYRSQNDCDSSTTADSVEEEDAGLDDASIDVAPPIDAPQEPIVLRERCRRQPKRFCCPSTTPGDKGRGKRRTRR
ncbi:uncharacterized protein [Coffea arabica]|uniref:Uncharacterized protein n=1 Tax=Coffea arabica TaxID=13443 RepID=A0ABM4UCI7_COFAR